MEDSKSLLSVRSQSSAKTDKFDPALTASFAAALKECSPEALKKKKAKGDAPKEKETVLPPQGSKPPSQKSLKPTPPTLTAEEIRAQQNEAEDLVRQAQAEKLKAKEKRAHERKKRDALKRQTSSQDSEAKRLKNDPSRPLSTSLTAHSSSNRHPTSTPESQVELDPTLDANGRIAKRKSSPPPAQSYDFKEDSDYPSLSPKTAKIRSLERDILKLTSSREDFENFSDSDVALTAQILFDSGLASIEELRKSRQMNRTFILEDLRAQGKLARELGLLLALFHHYTAQSRGRENKKALCEELHIPTLMTKFSANLQSLSPLNCA